jgi:gamma-glutamyltranspeptidase/glutathione hydrolase
MPMSRILIAEHSAVASEHPLSSLAGYDVLRRGGNAFDAAAATSFALAVTMHHVGGLGGDFFGMFYSAKTGKIHCLNSSGWAPSGLSHGLVSSRSEEGMPVHGPLSCVIPGQVAGVWAMHNRFGRLPFNRLLEAARSFAFQGFPVSAGFCRSTAVAFDSLPPDAQAVFAPDGRPPFPGERVRQANLGRVIEEIARGGARAFYAGWPAESIAEVLNAEGAPTEVDDFRSFEPEWVDPLVLDYHGANVFEMPPNSMGATTLLMLKILSERSFAEFGPLSKERVVSTMEAAETAYRRKDEILCDPRFEKVDMDEFMRPATDSQCYTGRVRGGDTTAFSVADAEGNLASCIQSLFHHYGSKVFVPACGMVLNNRASGFNLTGPNRVEPRKRPLHTLSSLIVELNEDSKVAIGASGGEYRPMQHTEFVTNLVDYHLSIEETVEHPRFLWRGSGQILVEAGFAEFQSPRYDVRRIPMPGGTGICHAIESRPGLRKAVCDVRGEGIPAGF